MAAIGLNFVQINLHHSKGASAVLARNLSMMHTAIALIQEPWIYRGGIRGLSHCGMLYSGEMDGARACILVRGLDAAPLPEFNSRDQTAVLVKYMDLEGERREVVVVSAYFPSDSPQLPPPMEFSRMVEACKARGLQLISGCDANSHHTVWGSMDINPRGGGLLEYLAGTDLEILNRGNEPTFQTTARESIIDITLCSGGLAGDVLDWRVSDEPSLSDHRQIRFRLSPVRRRTVWRRCPRATDWLSFKEELAGRLGQLPSRYGTRDEIDEMVGGLNRALISSFENNCPVKAKREAGGPTW